MAQSLDKYEAVLRAKGDGKFTPRSTLRAPLTHGVAPPLETLRTTSLRDVAQRVGAINTGRVLFLTTVGLATREIATTLLVEDAAGDTLLLSLYNWVLLSESPRAMFPPGSKLALLEPYARFARDDPRNPFILRCDNPQACILFDSDGEWAAAQARCGANPTRSPALASVLTAAECGALVKAGNDAFARAEWRRAERLYSSALRGGATLGDDSDLRSRALANRAEARPRAGAPEGALADAVAAAAAAPRGSALAAKAARRKAEALLRLGRPSEASAAVNELTANIAASDAQTLAFAKELQAATERGAREAAGVFDVAAMEAEAAAAAATATGAPALSPRHCEFASADIAVRDAPGAGRGTFATWRLRAGALVLASRAVAAASPPGAPGSSAEGVAALAVGGSSTTCDARATSARPPTCCRPWSPRCSPGRRSPRGCTVSTRGAASGRRRQATQRASTCPASKPSSRATPFPRSTHRAPRRSFACSKPAAAPPQRRRRPALGCGSSHRACSRALTPCLGHAQSTCPPLTHARHAAQASQPLVRTQLRPAHRRRLHVRVRLPRHRRRGGADDGVCGRARGVP